MYVEMMFLYKLCELTAKGPLISDQRKLFMQKCPLSVNFQYRQRHFSDCISRNQLLCSFLGNGSAMLIGSGIVSPLYIFSPPRLGIFCIHCLIFLKCEFFNANDEQNNLEEILIVYHYYFLYCFYTHFFSEEWVP